MWLKVLSKCTRARRRKKVESLRKGARRVSLKMKAANKEKRKKKAMRCLNLNVRIRSLAMRS